MKEKRLRLLVALGALPMALVACGTAPNGAISGAGGGNNLPAGSAGAPAAAVGGDGQVIAGAGAGPGVGTAGGGVDTPQTGPCAPGIPVTTQIPRLKTGNTPMWFAIYSGLPRWTARP